MAVPGKKWVNAKYIILYWSQRTRYEGEFSNKKQISYGMKDFTLCFDKNITKTLNYVNSRKVPSTNVFVYEVNSVGKVKIIVDWFK